MLPERQFNNVQFPYREVFLIVSTTTTVRTLTIVTRISRSITFSL